MTKKITAAERRRDEDFAGIVAGLGHAVAIAEGTADPSSYRIHAPAEVDVKSIRQRMAMTQGGFAQAYGFPLATVKQWEQKRRKPEGAARILLTVIDREPEAVQRALAGA